MPISVLGQCPDLARGRRWTAADGRSAPPFGRLIGPVLAGSPLYLGGHQAAGEVGVFIGTGRRRPTSTVDRGQREKAVAAPSPSLSPPPLCILTSNPRLGPEMIKDGCPTAPSS